MNCARLACSTGVSSGVQIEEAKFTVEKTDVAWQLRLLGLGRPPIILFPPPPLVDPFSASRQSGFFAFLYLLRCIKGRGMRLWKQLPH